MNPPDVGVICRAYAGSDLTFNLLTKYEVSSFIHSKDVIGPPKFMGHVTLTMPIWKWFVVASLTHVCKILRL